jgi:RNA polymerase sigma-70 factor (ECF subfamily)
MKKVGIIMGSDSDLPVVQKAIDMLSPESREVVDLLMRDIPYDVMADILGCSEGAVRVRVYRARKELKRYNVAA